MHAICHKFGAARLTGARPAARPGGCALLLALLVWLGAVGAIAAAPNIAVWGLLQSGGAPGADQPPADLTNAVAVAGSWYHVLALRQDAAINGWGDGFAGCTEIPPQLTNVVAVAAGWFDSVALQPGGLVTAWGYNPAGQTNVPPDLTNVVAIAAGAEHVLALRCDGSVVAWGDNTDRWGNLSGQTNVPPGLTNVVAIAAGNCCSVALRADGTVGGSGHAGHPRGLDRANAGQLPAITYALGVARPMLVPVCLLRRAIGCVRGGPVHETMSANCRAAVDAEVVLFSGSGPRPGTTHDGG